MCVQHQRNGNSKVFVRVLYHSFEQLSTYARIAWQESLVVDGQPFKVLSHFVKKPRRGDARMFPPACRIRFLSPLRAVANYNEMPDQGKQYLAYYYDACCPSQSEEHTQRVVRSRRFVISQRLKSYSYNYLFTQQHLLISS